MSTSTVMADERVADVDVTEESLTVRLMGGRSISVPVVRYSRPLPANPSQRHNWRVAGGGYGIRWPEVDEDLATDGLLRGDPAPGRE